MSSILRCLPVIKSHHAGHLLNSLQHQKALFLNPRYIRSVFVIIKKPRTINCAAFLLGPYFLASKKIKGLLIRLAIGFISSCNPFRNGFFFHCLLGPPPDIVPRPPFTCPPVTPYEADDGYTLQDIFPSCPLPLFFRQL